MIKQLLVWWSYLQERKMDKPVETVKEGYAFANKLLGYKVKNLRLWRVWANVTQKKDCFYVGSLSYSFFALKKNLIFPKAKTYDYYKLSLSNSLSTRSLWRGYYDERSVETTYTLEMDKVNVDIEKLSQIILGHSNIYYSNNDIARTYRLMLSVENSFSVWHVMDKYTDYPDSKLLVDAQTNKVLIHTDVY